MDSDDRSEELAAALKRLAHAAPAPVAGNHLRRRLRRRALRRIGALGVLMALGVVLVWPAKHEPEQVVQITVAPTITPAPAFVPTTLKDERRLKADLTAYFARIGAQHISVTKRGHVVDVVASGSLTVPVVAVETELGRLLARWSGARVTCGPDGLGLSLVSTTEHSGATL